MKKQYIIIIVIVFIAVALLFLGKKSKLEAPAVINEEENGSPVSNTMPILGNVNEMVVENEGQVKEFTISGKNFSFAPSAITVNKGDKVKITFQSSAGFHDFVIDEFGAATKQLTSPAEETIEFIADKTGTFEYYCSVGSHRAMGMKGTLTVK